MNWSVLLQTILAYVIVFIVVAVLLLVAPTLQDLIMKYVFDIEPVARAEEDKE